MSLPYTGELIAFVTVLCWSVGSQFFEYAGKRIGSLAVNMIKLLVAFVLFCLMGLITRGELIPTGFPLSAWKWLLISGVIGLAIGDMFLFRAFVEIGPRLAMLVMSLSAPLTALIGWLFLDEIYQPLQWVGLVVTLCGVSWVLIKQQGSSGLKESRSDGTRERTVSWRSLLVASGAPVGQAIGYTMSKIGMTSGDGYLDAFASTQIRIIGGSLGFILLFFVMGWWPKIMESTKDPKSILFSTFGGFLGPFLGVSLSLLALHYTSAGVASTIMSTTPIILIPFAIFIHKEHVSIHALIGTLVTFLGIVLLIS
jgi:drug/metabolite transporter (DMT)-like permease